MIGEIKIRERGPTPGLLKRAFNAMKQKCFLAAGIFWHKEFRVKHFTKSGATEYGYTPRKTSGKYGFKSSYTGRKLREKGHTKPLVWSGESMALTRMRDVRATSKRGRVVIRAPRFNTQPKNSTIDMRYEMTRVTEREAVQMIRVYDHSLDSQLRAFRATQSKTI